MSGAPRFSIVMPVYDPPMQALREALDSVRAQTYSDWELVAVDDCSPDPRVRDVLREYAAADPRIRLIERSENGHIAVASQDGVAAARGEFIALLDHDDTLAPEALARNAAVIDEQPDVDYLYSDEDKLRDGRCVNPVRKPVWSPERLRSQNYCNHFSVLRAELVRDVGGFRPGFEGSQDHDLVLRVTERARRVVHIPEVLYHWRVHESSAAANPDAKPYALEAGRRAVQEQVERLGMDARTTVVGPGRYRVSRALDPARRVSIVIPTRGASALVWDRRIDLVTNAVDSILAMTPHPNLEIVVVHDGHTPTRVLDDLRTRSGDRLLLMPVGDELNLSTKVNLGVLASSGEWLVLLHDDVQARNADWLPELLGPLGESDVGMTGARLSSSSSAVRHAGLAFVRGTYVHPYRSVATEVVDRNYLVHVNREVSGVSTACAAVRRDVFLEVGGLTERLPIGASEVDLSYKVRHRGYRIVYTAHSELFDFEPPAEQQALEPDQLAFLRHRWGVPRRDPYIPSFPDIPKGRTTVAPPRR